MNIFLICAACQGACLLLHLRTSTGAKGVVQGGGFQTDRWGVQNLGISW